MTPATLLTLTRHASEGTTPTILVLAHADGLEQVAGRVAKLIRKELGAKLVVTERLQAVEVRKPT